MKVPPFPSVIMQIQFIQKYCKFVTGRGEVSSGY